VPEAVEVPDHESAKPIGAANVKAQDQIGSLRIPKACTASLVGYLGAKWAIVGQHYNSTNYVASDFEYTQVLTARSV
jgi:hypothetical protein